jgi:hypothetical protein
VGKCGLAASRRYEPPWPFNIVLSLPLGGWTIERVAGLVDSAIGLLQAVNAGEFSRSVALQVLRANHPDALLGQHESLYLDVKQAHYDLDSAHGEIALAQAVARLPMPNTAVCLSSVCEGRRYRAARLFQRSRR